MDGVRFGMRPPKPEKDYPVRLRGHGLVSEGTPRFASRTCDQEECRAWQQEDTDSGGEAGSRISGTLAGAGHARCTCRAESEHLPSQGARRRWHQAHKREVVERMAADVEIAAERGGKEE